MTETLVERLLHFSGTTIHGKRNLYGQAADALQAAEAQLTALREELAHARAASLILKGSPEATAVYDKLRGERDEALRQAAALHLRLEGERG